MKFRPIYTNCMCQEQEKHNIERFQKLANQADLNSKLPSNMQFYPHVNTLFRNMFDRTHSILANIINYHFFFASLIN